MSDEVFKPISLPINNLFGNVDSLYRIPEYQRPYSWTDEHVTKLWEDLTSAYESDSENTESDENYFLGSVIVAESKKSNYQDVIDGQQRLTTLMILFCTLRDKFPNLGKSKDGESIKGSISIGRLKRCIFDDDDQLRLKLKTHSNHQNDFEKTIIKGIDLENLKKPKKKDIDSSVVARFQNTAYMFNELLNDYGEEKSSYLLQYIFNKVRVIKITCNSETSAIKLFQVLNDRGLDLSSSDLIKSYLMANVHDAKRDQFVDDWKRVETIAEDMDVKLDDLFTLYQYYALESNPEKSLADEMRDYFKTWDPNEAINDFKSFCLLYRDEIEDKEGATLNSLHYLNWTMYWKMIALTALKENYGEYNGLLQAMHRYYYLNWIAGKTLTTIKQISFNVVKYIKAKKSLEFIEAEFNKKIESDGIIKLFKDSVQNDAYYNRWIKPLLLTIEYSVTDDSKMDTHIYMDKHLHVEHILPQKFISTKGWEHINEKKGKELLNSLGNLTLLSGKKNIEASNNSFEIKKEVYRGLGKYKNKKDGVTSFNITEKLINDKLEVWDETKIIERSNWYLGIIESILKVDLEDIKIKIS